MLKTLRIGAQSLVIKSLLFGLLLMAMGGLALLDVQGMIRNRLSENTAAKIDGDKISARELEHMVNTVLRAQNIPASMAGSLGIPAQVLAQNINRRLFVKAAQDLGYIPDNAMVAARIKTMIAPSINEKTSEKEAFAQLLNTTGFSEEQLVQALRGQMATEALLETVGGGVVAPPLLTAAFDRYQHEKREGVFFLLSPQDLSTAVQPKEVDLKAYYETVQAQFMTPEYRDLDLLVLNKAALGFSKKVDEAALRTYYNEHQADYTSAETRLITQAVVSSADLAQQVYKAAKDKHSLEQAARALKISILPARTFTEKDMAAELAAVAFRTPAKTVATPIKTALGWVVLEVGRITAAHVQPFDSVRDALAKAASEDVDDDLLYQKLGKIDDQLASGQSLSEIADSYGQKLQSLKKIEAKGEFATPSKTKPSIPGLEKLLEAAFRLGKGETSSVIEGPEGTFLIAHVKEIYAPEAPAFESVRNAVATQWRETENARHLEDAKTILDIRLKKGESFEAVAKGFNKTPQSTSLLSRENTGGTSKDKADSVLHQALFSLEKVNDVKVVRTQQGLAVLKLSRRQAPSVASSAEDQAALTAHLTQDLKNSVLDQYRENLMKRYDVTINEAVVKDMFKPRAEEGAEP